MRKKYLTTKEAAAFIGRKESTMKWWRFRRVGPAFFKPPGTNLVFYTQESLVEFIESNKIIF